MCGKNFLLIILFTLFILMPNTMPAQSQGGIVISKFALSANPVGFVQFGPIINAEFGIQKNLVLNAHVRFPALGLLSYVAADHNDGLDDFKGIAFGGGIIKFFGERRHKPYLGGLIDYQTHETLYAEDEDWEWSKTNDVLAFIVNGGYRFRFSGGFFINTGAYLGFAIDKSEWEYTDTSEGSWGSRDDSSRDDSEIIPFYMLEVTLGLEL